MNKMLTSVALLMAAITLSSCNTTGDPNAGGYFGWSQKKATERQNVLRSELDFKNQTGNDLKSKRDSLISQRNALRAKIAKAKKDVVTAKNPTAKVEASNRLQQLNRELNLLESTI